MTHDEYNRGKRMAWWCTRTTAAGDPCKGNRVSWHISDTPNSQACIGHLPHAEKEEWKKAAQQAEAEHTAAEAAGRVSDPACWSWPSPPTAEDVARLKRSYSPGVQARLTDADFAEAAMTEWQQGRCAICGARGSLVVDHDHQTGLVRGKLCPSCNTREGHRHGGIWDKYRQRNPATICGVENPYLDPFTLEEARPAPPPGDPWQNNPMKAVDL